MVKSAPALDTRSRSTIAEQVAALLQTYGALPPGTQPAGITAALVNIFARYGELIVQRLNQVPDKNFLAFLNLLGAFRLPPQPARVPLTFTLAAGSASEAVIPARTPVAAPPRDGEAEPTRFETEQELVVTAARLVAVMTRDPATDCYRDSSAIAQPVAATGLGAVPIFSGDRPVEHAVYFAYQDLLAQPLTLLELRFTLNTPLGSEGEVVWEAGNGQDWQALTPSSPPDLATPGEKILQFAAFPGTALTTVNGSEGYWVRGRLTTPIVRNAGGSVELALPELVLTGMATTLSAGNLIAERAFTDQAPVDASQTFFPFGEKPKVGSTFYFAHSQAFAQPGATVVLTMLLESPGVATDNSQLVLAWEYWNGQRWRAVEGLIDPTNRLTVATDERIELRITDGAPPQPRTINGVESYWLRVRIVSGGYGRDAQYLPVANTEPQEYELIPATFAPPIIRSLSIAYTVSRDTTDATLDLAQIQIQACNDFTCQAIAPATAFQPFQPLADPRPTAYLGFQAPSGLPNRNLSLYAALSQVGYTPGDNVTAVPQASPRLAWSYWNGSAWRPLAVEDDSQAFTQPGTLSWLPPADAAPKSSELGLSHLYWLRVRWSAGDYAREPQLRRLLLNTTTAIQAATIGDEILGSSNGEAGQTFRTQRSPVLTGQQLEVRESELPSATERDKLEREEGSDAIREGRNTQGEREIWVRWHEVPDFYGSGPRDRHYLCNHLSGDIQFGDGRNGLIPPVGSGNLRLARYQIGGGIAGNQAAGTITQLKTTVPFIEAVINWEAAAGGTEAESLTALKQRLPHTLRHGGRAVAAEDYEDLAKLASPAVARAKVEPLLDLHADPLAPPNLLGQPPHAPGSVSVIVVPRARAAKPVPSLELLSRVQTDLENHAIPTVAIAVVGPLYLAVSVSAEIVVADLEGSGRVEKAVNKALADFLHPLTGGFDAQGWPFGRQPYRSDFFRLLERVPGVERVGALSVSKAADNFTVAEIEQTGRFLVYSGPHTINLRFEEG